MLENPEDPNTDAADEAVDAEGADGDEALDAADSSEGVEAELVELEPAYVRELRADLEAANSENDALQAQLNELKERLRAVSQAYQKQQDEVSATRERLERQAVVKEELRRGEVVSSLFEPVENLRRSLDALRRGASAEDTATGLDLVFKEFMSAFGALGLEEVPGKGARFDPKIHEALTTTPVMDEALDQAVVDVFAAGFRIGSRLIRPAKVIVGAYTAPIAEA
jgi:molecular chaperone GrpE